MDVWYKKIAKECRAKGLFRVIHDYHDEILDYARPHMIRYQWQGTPDSVIGIAFHEILTSDIFNALHNHGGWYQTLILEGSYDEQLIDGIYKREVGYVGFTDADKLHRLHAVEAPCWTMWTHEVKAQKKSKFLIEGKLVDQAEWADKTLKAKEIHCPLDYIKGDPKNYRWSDEYGCMVQIISR